MNAAGRLAAFGTGLAVAFAGAYAAAGAIVPESAVTTWQQQAAAHADMPGMDHDSGPTGLSLGQGGYTLGPVRTPATTAAPGELSFAILGADGTPLRDYDTTHDRDLHLIAVRSDGAQFRHAHPRLDRQTGVWSLPWRWDSAGTYRVFADFQPAEAPALTLSRTVQVAGDFNPIEAGPVRRTAEVDGFTVTLRGDLTPGDTEKLTVEFARDGHPVTDLQPYLGAFGHLVALRDGDLAFLHAHPEGAEPTADQRGGPTATFATQAPTAGRYLLYLDFQVDDQVRTATFVVDTAHRHVGEDEHS